MVPSHEEHARPRRIARIENGARLGKGGRRGEKKEEVGRWLAPFRVSKEPVGQKANLELVK